MRRVLRLIALVLMFIAFLPGRPAHAQSGFLALLYCTPWSGCGTFHFTEQDVTVYGVVENGELDVDGSGWWGFWNASTGYGLGDMMYLETNINKNDPAPEPISEPGCGDARDDAILEYTSYQVGWVPACGDFASSGGTANFWWSELSNGTDHGSWAIVKSSLTGGLEGTRSNWGGPINLTSGYRCPGHNASVGGVPTSRHQFGDAADMKPNGTWNHDVWLALREAVIAANGTNIESWEQDNSHLHAEWH